MFLCFRRSASSSVVDVMVLFPKKGDRLPYGYVDDGFERHGVRSNVRPGMTRSGTRRSIKPQTATLPT